MANKNAKVQPMARTGNNRLTGTVRLPTKLHSEIKVAAAHRHESIITVIDKAWETFKREQGRRLHDEQEMAHAS